MYEMRQGEGKRGQEEVKVMADDKALVEEEVSENIERMADVFLEQGDGSNHREGADFRRDFNAMWSILKDEIGETLRNPRMVAYLAAYSIIGSVTYAAKCAGVSTTAVYNWKENPVFMEYYEQAEKAHLEYMELEAQRRAVMGTTEDVYYKGEVVGQKKRYSDSLLKFLLKGKSPEKYRDTSKVEIKGGKDSKIQVNFGIPELNEEIDVSEVEE